MSKRTKEDASEERVTAKSKPMTNLVSRCSVRDPNVIGGTEMANVEQTQKMIPFIACEISLCQYVCELVFGVSVFDLDFGVQIDSIEHSLKSNSVGSGNMSHCGASSLYDHLDHCFVVYIQQSFPGEKN